MNIRKTCSQNREKLGDALPLDTPFMLYIDVSEKCNFSCNYCFRSNLDKSAWGYAKENNLMNWEVFEKLIHQLNEFPQKIKSISLSNHGEPLCNKRLIEMIKYIKLQGITSELSIHTNASLLNNESARTLVQTGIDKIVVSLQGLTSDDYLRISKSDLDFHALYENIKIMYQNKKPNTKIFVKILSELINDEDEKNFFDMFSEISDGALVEKTVPIWKGNNLDKTFYNKFGEVYENQSACGFSFYTLVVTPSGEIFPCTQLLCSESLGNVNSTSLFNAWISDKRKYFLERQLIGDVQDYCVDCYIKQNAICSEHDLIDEYRIEIYERMFRKGE